MSSVWAKADRKNIQLSVDCAPSVTVQHCPTKRTRWNILDNGVKYTPEGGAFPYLFAVAILYANYISDTGIGIHEGSFTEPVFQRFYSAQEAAAEEGVGLGAVSCQRNHYAAEKGYISVKSNYGEGATFSVLICSVEQIVYMKKGERKYETMEIVTVHQVKKYFERGEHKLKPWMEFPTFPSLPPLSAILAPAKPLC